MIYFNDHSPAHVHVKKAAAQAVSRINDDGTAELREIYGMSRSDSKVALEIVEANSDYLRTEWKRIHG